MLYTSPRPEIHPSMASLTCYFPSQGLSGSEVRARMLEYGENLIKISVPPVLHLVIHEGLNPFFLFQGLPTSLNSIKIVNLSPMISFEKLHLLKCNVKLHCFIQVSMFYSLQDWNDTWLFLNSICCYNNSFLWSVSVFQFSIFYWSMRHTYIWSK